jgi:Ca-activated chloride channel homolog
LKLELVFLGDERKQLMHWSDIHFLRPWWLLLLALAVLTLRPLSRAAQASPWAKVVAPHLLPHLLSGHQHRRTFFWAKLLFPLFLAFLAVALAGPTAKKMPTDVGLGKAPIIIALLVNDNMLKEDIAPNRLKRATYKMLDLFQMYKGAEVALIAFAGDAHVVVPFTEDYNTVSTLAKTLSPELMPKAGLDIASVITHANSMASRKPQAQLVLMMSGGEQDSVINAIKTSTLPTILWNFDETSHALPSIAGATLVKFSPDGSDINAIVSMLSKNSSAALSPRDYFYDTWVDLGPYFLLIAMIILAVVFFFARDQVLVLGLLLVLSPIEAKANWFLRPDQQGQRAFDRGDYAQAAKLFEDDLRKGSAYYRAKMYDQAISHLSRVNSTDGRYNLGNAYAHKGQYPEAIKAYTEALQLDSNNLDAKTNKELLEELLKNQQQQPQDQNQSDQDQNKQKDSQSNASPDQKDSGEQKEKSGNQSQKEQSGQPESKKPEQKNEEHTSAGKESKKPADKQQQVKASKPEEKALDPQTRYYFDQLEQKNSLFLKRKFRYETEKNQGRK